ncbi:MAG: nucleotide pyrophosphohydrolase [Oscillibacter sp.]|nr:nucleotide pyrophosphohydrolase [Oscillibacter sp.]
MMKVTIEELEAYLSDHYGNGGIDQSLFMKLVEEIGEVAEVLNKKAGRKSSGNEDLQAQLGNELADVIHYAVAIAALNGLDMNDIIIRKDKTASVKYNHRTNLEQFVLDKRNANAFIEHATDGDI